MTVVFTADVSGGEMTLVNVVKDSADASFELCKQGSPKDYEDHLVVQHENGQNEYLCEDRAREILEPLNLWPVNGQWKNVVGKVSAQKNERLFSLLEDQNSPASAKIAILNSLNDSVCNLTPSEQNRSISTATSLLSCGNQELATEAALFVIDKTSNNVEAAEALADALKTEEDPVRRRSLLKTMILQANGTLTPKIGEVLVDILKKPFERSADFSADVIGLLGQQSELSSATITSLTFLASDLHADLWVKALETLAKFDPKTAAKVIVKVDWSTLRFGKDMVKLTDIVRDLNSQGSFNGYQQQILKEQLKAVFVPCWDNNSIFDIAKNAVEILHSIDPEEAIDFIAPMLEGDHNVFTYIGRDAGLMKAYTIIFRRYQSQWDDTRRKIAKALAWGIVNEYGDNYYICNVLRALCLYPDEIIREPIEETRSNGNWNKPAEEELDRIIAKLDHHADSFCLSSRECTWSKD